jgi:hypothetical protein
MLDWPVIVDEPCEGLVLIGSVHSLREPARDIIKKMAKLSPDYVCVELSAPLQPTKSFELEMARERYLDRLVCIDRPIEVTVSRYMCGTRPIEFLKEAVVRYLCLPLNVISIIAYSNLPRLYKMLTGGRFYTFGWSEWDSRAYIFERDEYMAGRLASMLKSGELRGKCVVLTGRRHVPGMRCILDAFKSTNDIGSYYAGGRVHDVFSLAELEEPYRLSYEESSRTYIKNRLIESIVRAIFLSLYVLCMFLLLAALILMATAGALILIRIHG